MQCTCELAAAGCLSVDNSLLRAVGDRCTDRVGGIRMDAITGLAQVYKHVISSEWDSIGRTDEDELSDDEDAAGALAVVACGWGLAAACGWFLPRLNLPV